MTKRDQAIEKAARELRAAQDTAHINAMADAGVNLTDILGEVCRAEEALDAALALPPCRRAPRWTTCSPASARLPPPTSTPRAGGEGGAQ